VSSDSLQSECDWYLVHVQVGQVILTYPYQMALMGIIPAVIVAIGVGLLNYFTLWLLVIMYLERKRYMVRTLNWTDHVTAPMCHVIVPCGHMMHHVAVWTYGCFGIVST